MFEIIITADTNDADYLTNVSQISEADLERLKPMIEKIKGFKKYSVDIDGLSWEHRNNFPYGECLRRDLGEKSVEELYGFDEEDMDFLMDYIPTSEYGVHTIKSITVAPLMKKTKLL